MRKIWSMSGVAVAVSLIVLVVISLMTLRKPQPIGVRRATIDSVEFIARKQGARTVVVAILDDDRRGTFPVDLECGAALPGTPVCVFASTAWLGYMLSLRQVPEADCATLP